MEGDSGEKWEDLLSLLAVNYGFLLDSLRTGSLIMMVARLSLCLPFSPLHFPACVLFLVKLQHFPPNILQLNDIQLILSHIS